MSNPYAKVKGRMIVKYPPKSFKATCVKSLPYHTTTTVNVTRKKITFEVRQKRSALGFTSIWNMVFKYDRNPLRWKRTDRSAAIIHRTKTRKTLKTHRDSWCRFSLSRDVLGLLKQRCTFQGITKKKGILNLMGAGIFISAVELLICGTPRKP